MRLESKAVCCATLLRRLATIRPIRAPALLVITQLLASWAWAASDGSPAPPVASIPRVERSPVLEDFLEMKAGNGLEGKLAKIEHFIQREPRDGQPSSERTDVYLAYNDKNLFVIFIAFDSEPEKIRAHLTRRENIQDDDQVEVMLDTFHDQRRAYSFATNPLGVQLDQLYTEGQGYNDSFDTLWDSRGKVTSQGYVVWISIPFRSLRFLPSGQNWGIVLRRGIPRLNEDVYWPRVSSRIEGRLNQEAILQGLERISPGRNIQLIPYGVFRSFRTLDQRNPSAPFFENKAADGAVGLDAKFVLKDRLVLDFAVNPDFSQVESDEPQTTVNQRFEVFFPEKRPFFLENSNFFETPINLVFTRRIADPQFGARITGKLGQYAIGALFADDRSPGKRVPDNDPLAGKRAHFGIVRVNRDVSKGSTLGIIFADRELQNAFNRVAGVDVHFKFRKNWVGDGQAVSSSTRFPDGTSQAGPAYQAYLQRDGRKLYFDSLFLDNSPGFLTQTGFFRRPDIRRFSNFARYRFRPEGKHFISHGPGVFQLNLWAHDGTPLEQFVNANYLFEFKPQTVFGVFANTGSERLRPSDFSALQTNQNFPKGHHGIFFFTSFFPQVTAFAEAGWGKAINFGPAAGPPVSARSNYVDSGLTVRPVRRLTIENRYILSSLRVPTVDSSIFTDHIIRSKWNYQITRALSVRLIGQYNATLSNSKYSSLPRRKNGNLDFLVTYLLHPGTAVYVGYNSNLQNLDPSLAPVDSGLLRTRSRFINDGRQFFVKVSYLFRF